MSGPQLVNDESAFVLRGKGDVDEKLRLMEKARSILTVSLGNDGYTFGTMVVKVFPDKGILALDLSANPAATKRMLEADKVTCLTSVQGVEARFELGQIRAATFNGEELIAVRIPDSLFWLQRREFYRVVVPDSHFMKCRVTLGNGEVAEFAVHNLSLLGMALLDNSGCLWTWGREGQQLGPCWLRTPGFEGDEFALEIRNKIETTRVRGHLANIRMGCAFRGVDRGFEIKLQKLIYELEREARRQNDDEPA